MLEKCIRSVYESWMVGQEEVGSYTHRGIYGTDGRSQCDNRAPTTSARRCTTICMQTDMREYRAFWIRSVIASYESRTIDRHKTRHSHTVCDPSKQRALTYRTAEISYRGVHFNVGRDMVGGGGCCLSVRERCRHCEVIFGLVPGGLMIDRSQVPIFYEYTSTKCVIVSRTISNSTQELVATAHKLF